MRYAMTRYRNGILRYSRCTLIETDTSHTSLLYMYARSVNHLVLESFELKEKILVLQLVWFFFSLLSFHQQRISLHLKCLFKYHGMKENRFSRRTCRRNEMLKLEVEGFYIIFISNFVCVCSLLSSFPSPAVLVAVRDSS